MSAPFTLAHDLQALAGRLAQMQVRGAIRPATDEADLELKTLTLALAQCADRPMGLDPRTTPTPRAMRVPGGMS